MQEERHAAVLQPHRNPVSVHRPRRCYALCLQQFTYPSKRSGECNARIELCSCALTTQESYISLHPYSVRSQAKDSRKAMVEQSEFNEELSEQEDRLPCRQTAGSWNVLDTLAYVIDQFQSLVSNQKIPQHSARFCGIP
jgi:hypothetical protein